MGADSFFGQDILIWISILVFNPTLPRKFLDVVKKLYRCDGDDLFFGKEILILILAFDLILPRKFSDVM